MPHAMMTTAKEKSDRNSPAARPVKRFFFSVGRAAKPTPIPARKPKKCAMMSVFSLVPSIARSDSPAANGIQMRVRGIRNRSAACTAARMPTAAKTAVARWPKAKEEKK